MKTECLWAYTSAEPLPITETLSGRFQTQVCVIGGGITGLSTALHLAREGVSVCVLESGEVGSGGSGANVGLVNAGAWLPPDDLVARLGRERGGRLNTLLGVAPDVVFQLVDQFGIQCSATRTGTLHLAHNKSGVSKLVRRHRQFLDAGAPVELKMEADCHALVGSQRFPAALLDRRAGTLNPCAYTRGLARAAQSSGAQIFTRSPATGLQRQSGKWQVNTTNGTVFADSVVLATNAYTEEHWNAVKAHFFPAYFCQVASVPMTGHEADLIFPHQHGAWDTRLVLSSLRRDAQGRLIFGSLGRGETKPLAWIRRWADEMRRRIFPNLSGLSWETTWTGRMAFTPDHVLRLFSPAEGILAVAGYNGRGITTGTVVGRGFAHLLLTGEDRLLPLPIHSYSAVKGRPLRSVAYETGFSLYHAGQCLRLVT